MITAFFAGAVNGAWIISVGFLSNVLGNTMYDLGKTFVEVYFLNKDKEDEQLPTRDAN